MTPEEISRQSAVLEAVTRDLERAGVSGIKRMDLVRALLDPSTETQDEKDFRRLQELGNPDYEGQGGDSETLFGEPAPLLDAKMNQEFLGRGWSPQDRENLRREPAAMELSPGGRQADEYRRRRDLIQGVSSPSTAQKMGSFIPDALLSDPQKAPTSLDRYFDDPVKAFDAQRDRNYGTSGFVGAMENPEYTGGWYLNNLATPFSDTIQYGLHEGEEWQSSMERANERRQALRAGKAVDPILPGGTDRDSKELLFKSLRTIPDQMRPKTYDMSFRQEHGYYPSYADSVATDLAENFPDLMTAATVGAGAFAKKGVGLLAKWLGGEALEEVPPYAAIVGGTQIAAGDKAPSLPAWKDWGASRGAEVTRQKFGANSNEFTQAKEAANVARTDQYIRDPQTQKFRPETEEEFQESVKNFGKSQGIAEKAWSQMKGALQQR